MRTLARTRKSEAALQEGLEQFSRSAMPEKARGGNRMRGRGER